MEKFGTNITLSESRHPIISLLVIVLFAFSGFQLIGPIIGILVTLPFMDIGMMEAMEQIADPIDHPEMKVPIFIIQGIASAIGFIFIPLLYLWKIEKKTLFSFINEISLRSLPILLLGLVTLSFMFANSVFVEWNQSLRLPESLSGLEKYLRYMEEAAHTQTEFLTTFDSGFQFFLAFLVIAVIPAFGEELLFRGFVQNLLFKAFNNIHLAIWIAAFLFSAFHLQFYGLIPRMFLGVLFGYLYYWSGSLSTPIIAHFINNGFTILLMYMYQQNLTELNIESEDSIPWSVVIVLFLVFSSLTFMYYNHFKKIRATE